MTLLINRKGTSIPGLIRRTTAELWRLSKRRQALRLKRFLRNSFNSQILDRFLTQMCARFSPSRSAAPWEEAADVLVPANQR